MARDKYEFSVEIEDGVGRREATDLELEADLKMLGRDDTKELIHLHNQLNEELDCALEKPPVTGFRINGIGISSVWEVSDGHGSKGWHRRRNLKK